MSEKKRLRWEGVPSKKGAPGAPRKGREVTDMGGRDAGGVDEQGGVEEGVWRSKEGGDGGNGRKQAGRGRRGRLDREKPAGVVLTMEGGVDERSGEGEAMWRIEEGGDGGSGRKRAGRRV